MLIEILQVIGALLIAVVFHEVAHGWVADKLGDPTARLSGRLTLNPLKHIDPIGTIVVPLALKLLGVPFVIGWAKPVPVNFFNLRDPKRDMIKVALAGPATNFFLAILFSQVLRLTGNTSFSEFLVLLVMVNLVLGVFNMLPVPPLDGSRLITGILPRDLARAYNQLERYGLIILLVLMNFGFLDFLPLIVSYLAFWLGIGPWLIK